jgi:hypothetical protein
LQRKLKELVNARRFKIAFVKKEVSEKNREERVTFGKEHVSKTIKDFWSLITYTDKAYVNPNSQPIRHILREEEGNQRYADENIIKRKEIKETAFHIAAYINW